MLTSPGGCSSASCRFFSAFPGWWLRCAPVLFVPLRWAVLPPLDQLRPWRTRPTFSLPAGKRGRFGLPSPRCGAPSRACPPFPAPMWEPWCSGLARWAWLFRLLGPSCLSGLRWLCLFLTLGGTCFGPFARRPWLRLGRGGLARGRPSRGISPLPAFGRQCWLVCPAICGRASWLLRALPLRRRGVLPPLWSSPPAGPLGGPGRPRACTFRGFTALRSGPESWAAAVGLLFLLRRRRRRRRGTALASFLSSLAGLSAVTVSGACAA